MNTMPIVVGIDGSTYADAAVNVAADEAALRGCPLHIYYALAPRYMRYDIAGTGAGVAETIKNESKRILEAEKERVLERHPRLEIETFFVEEHPVDVLVEASEEAQLLVVGVRGLGAIRRFFVGSVSRAVSQESLCPVMLVRPGTENKNGPVIAGLGPDDGAADILEYAFKLAELRKAKLVAIHGRQHAGANFYDIELSAYRELVTKRMSAVDAKLKKLYNEAAAKHPDVDATFRSSPAHAIDALLNASEEASILVVGRCSSSKRNKNILGSVAEGVLSEAKRAVVVPPAM